MKRWRLHWSHLSCYARCGEQFRRRYVEGEIRAPGIALIAGSATHEGIEAVLKYKQEAGELPELDRGQAAARDYVAREWADGHYRLTGREVDELGGPDAARDHTIDTSVGLVECHYVSLADEIQPTAVERPWVVKLKDYPFDLAGQIDVEESGRIRDTKTAARRPSAGQEHTMPQLTMYALAKRVLDGHPPAEIFVDWLVKNKTPVAVSRATHRTVEDFRALLARVEATWRGIEAGVFPPISREEWMCDPRWCGYFYDCKYVRGWKQFAL
ncbi:MAG: PD-(D/E)XK nuclease family protein [Planctomycetota bacterium]